MPRQDWKAREVRAGLPPKTFRDMAVVAADIEQAIGEGAASRNDVVTWLIHWFLTQDFKTQRKIAEAGKAIEESLKPKEGNPYPVGSGLPSRTRAGTAKVWTSRINRPPGNGADGLNCDSPAAFEMSEPPCGK